MQYSPGKKGFEKRSWAMRVAKKIYDLCLQWLMAFFFLFNKTNFQGSAFRCLKTGEPIDVVLEIAARESGVPIGDILENLPAELSVWVDPGEVSYRIGEKGAVKVNFHVLMCPTLKLNIDFIFFFSLPFTSSRRFCIRRPSTILLTIIMLTARWLLPSILKLSAFVRLKLSVQAWADWHWARKVHPMTRHRHHRQVPCTRTTAPVPIAARQHSLDDNTSPFSSRPRPLHKQNSAAQS